MRFLVMAYAGTGFPPRDELEDDVRGWIAEAETRGVRVLGGRLAPPGEATVVTGVDGELERRPGPRLPTDTQLVGFDVVEAADVYGVLEMLGRHPMTRHHDGSVEVRAILD